MPKGKKKNKNGTQTFLAFIFAIVLSIGFIGVWYVEAYYDLNGDWDLLFETDSETEFPIIEYGESYPTVYYPSLRNSQRELRGSDYLQYNRTAVYSGNNTYSMAVNSTDGNRNTVAYLIEIPNANRWTISNLIINMTRNTDTDINFEISFIHWNTVLEDDDLETDIYLSYGIGSATGEDYNLNRSIPLESAIELYDNANAYSNTALYITYADQDFDGLTGFAWEMKVTIYGEQLTGWSKLDSVNLAIGFADGILIVACVFLTDAIDVGGFVRDLPKRKR